MKLVTRIINDRIMKVLIEKRILNEDQHAGRPGTSTNEAIYKMIATIEEAAERGQRIYATQIDMSKAFDSVPHWSIRLSLRRLGIPAECVDFMRRLDRGTSQVLTAFALTEEYTIWKGVRQGEVASPMKWVAFFDTLLDMQKEAVKEGVKVGGDMHYIWQRIHG